MSAEEGQGPGAQAVAPQTSKTEDHPVPPFHKNLPRPQRHSWWFSEAACSLLGGTVASLSFLSFARSFCRALNSFSGPDKDWVGLRPPRPPASSPITIITLTWKGLRALTPSGSTCGSGCRVRRPEQRPRGGQAGPRAGQRLGRGPSGPAWREGASGWLRRPQFLWGCKR